jgi:G3E family GTPase
MTYDIAGLREGWTEEGDDCAGQRQVTELLAEQVEAADLILINKIDMASKEEAIVASTVARGA